MSDSPFNNEFLFDTKNNKCFVIVVSFKIYFNIYLSRGHNTGKMLFRTDLPMKFVIIVISIISVSNGEKISRNAGIPLWNLTRTHEYEDNIVTSRLDVMQPVVWLYRGIREVYNRFVLIFYQRDIIRVY